MLYKTYFAIRHKPTDTLFPTSKTGNTFVDLPFKGPPRLFATTGAARGFLTLWLKGPMVKTWVQSANILEDDRGTFVHEPKYCNGPRIREEFEVIAVYLERFS